MTEGTSRNLLMGLALVAIVAAAAVAVVAGYLQRGEAARMREAIGREEARDVASMVDLLFENKARRLDLLASRPAVALAGQGLTRYLNMDRVRMTPSLNEGPEPEIFALISQIASLHPEWVFVAIGMADGGYMQWPESITPTTRFDPRLSAWYRDAVAAGGNMVGSAPFPDPFTGEPVIAFSQTFDTFDGVRQRAGSGVLAIVASTDAVVLLNWEDSVNGRVLVLHEEGWVVFDSARPEVGAQPMSEVDSDGLDLAWTESGDPFRVRIDDETFLGLPEAAQAPGWYAVTLVPEAEIAPLTSTVVFWAVVAGVIAVLVTAFVAFPLSGQLAGGVRRGQEQIRAEAIQRKHESDVLRSVLEEAATMQRLASASDVAKAFLRSAHELADVSYGTVYLFGVTDGERRLHLAGSFATSEIPSDTLSPGEGIVGQVALDGMARTIPADATLTSSVASALGSARPERVTVLPIEYDAAVLGVTELGFLHAPSELAERVSGELVTAMAVAIDSLDVAAPGQTSGGDA